MAFSLAKSGIVTGVLLPFVFSVILPVASMGYISTCTATLRPNRPDLATTESNPQQLPSHHWALLLEYQEYSLAVIRPLQVLPFEQTYRVQVMQSE